MAEDEEEIDMVEEVKKDMDFKKPEFGQVATIARDGVVILYEFLPIEEARAKAKEILKTAYQEQVDNTEVEDAL